MECSLNVSPNPLVLSRNIINEAPCTMEIKNNCINLILFYLNFDDNLFSCISPACGELEPNSSRTLKLMLEDLSTDIKDLTFSIRYYIALPGTNSDKIRKLMLEQDKWKDKVDVKIKFLSHEEESLKSFSEAFKQNNKCCINTALEKKESLDLEKEKISNLKKKIQEKEKENLSLLAQLNILKNLNGKQKEELMSYQNNPDLQSIFLIVAFFIFVLSLIIRRILK